MAFAHSENRLGIKHDLVEHLKSVAQMAAEFAGKFGLPTSATGPRRGASSW